MSIRRNTTYNLVGKIIPIGLSLLTIPLYLNTIGESRYGILAIAWLLLGYFGLFDLGLGRATAQRIAVLHDAPAKERANTFWTALSLNACFGLVGSFVFLPIALWFFGNKFQMEESLRPEVLEAVPWLLLAVPMATVSGVLYGALQGREKFLEINLISVIGTALFQVLPLSVAVLWSVNLTALLIAALVARFFTLLALFLRCRIHVFGGHSYSYTHEQAGGLIRFGGWITVTSFVGPMMVALDRFFIGALLGAKSVSYYTVPFQLGTRSTIFASSLVSALFPRFAAATKAEENRLVKESFQTLIVIMTPLTAGGIVLMEPFIAWWIDKEFAQFSAVVGQIILLGFWFNSFAMIPFVRLQANGRPDLVAKCHIAELLPYFGLLYLGMKQFGLIGVAIAFSLRVTLDFILLAGFAKVLVTGLRVMFFPALLLSLILSISVQSGFEWVQYQIILLALTVFWSWRQTPIVFREALAKWFAYRFRH
ncbi:flippase [Pseudomonadota bacterium]